MRKKIKNHTKNDQKKGFRLDHGMQPDLHSKPCHADLNLSENAKKTTRILGGAQIAILDALSSHIALVDPQGVIIAVNAAWRRFGTENDLPESAHGVGMSYLQVCERVQGKDAGDAQLVGSGLRRVLAGELLTFTHEYPCHAPRARRWFLITITPISEELGVGAMLVHLNITERKIAELALQESEGRFRSTFENAAVGVAHVASDGRFIQANASLCNIVGYAQSEIVHVNFLDLSFPEHRPQVERARLEMLAGTIPSYSSEKRFCKKTGESVWVNVVVAPVKIQGVEPYFVSVIEDITLRKNSDLRLQRINRLYLVLSKIGSAVVKAKTPSDLFDDVVKILARDGMFRIVLIVEALPEDTGVRTVAVAGEAGDYLENFIISKDSHSAFSKGTIGTALRTGRYDVCNDFAQDPRMAPWQAAAARNNLRATASFPIAVSGMVTLALVLFSGETDYFREDEIALMIAVSENISFALDAMHQERQRIAVEEASRNNERRFRALSEQSADGVSLVDRDGRILYLSPSVATIEGYDPSELVNRNGIENTHPDDLPLVRRTMSELLDNPGKPTPVLWRRRHKNGHWLWLEGVSTNLLDDPAIRAIVTNYRDVSDRKRAEAEIRHSQALLRMASRLGRIGAWAVDLPSLALTWSDEIKAIHDVPVDFVPQIEAAIDFYAPEYRLSIVTAVEACRIDGQPFDLELQIITAKNRRVWVRSIGEAVRNERGEIHRIQGAFQDISERKQAEEEYRHVAERLTATLESITEAFYTVDREWRYTYVNSEAERIMRRNRSQLLGNTLWDVFPEARETSFCSSFEQAMRDGTARHLHDYYAPHDAWYEVHLYPSSQGMAIYVRDVSEQHRSREALRLSEERFRLVSMATNDVLWDWDPCAETIWWNEGYEAQFGYSRTGVESSFQFWADHIHDDDRPHVLSSIQEVVEQGGERWSVEYRFRHKDGSYARVSDCGYILRNHDGKVVRMIGAMSDHTTRKLAEERIAEQAALLDEARDAISVCDLHSGATYMNRSAERLYGWQFDEIVGRSVRGLLFPDVRAYDRAFAHVMKHGEWMGELSPKHRDGRQLLTECRWTLVRNSAGMPRSVLCFCTDIAERKKLEQQFMRAQRMESIGTLAGGIAHDLNNVLTPIVLSIRLLKRGEQDEKRLRTLAMIDASAQRGADMVKHVLSFARGVDGLRLPVKIRPLVREIEKIINDTFLKNIHVRTVIAQDLWVVTGDATQLHQVLLNLCVNARDAMPDGGTITLSIDNRQIDEEQAVQFLEAKPGPYVIIGVADTGTGMSPEIMEKIFEPFFTTKEIGKGTGLGLSTSLAMIKSHGGFLRVVSELGKGTEFKVYLPARVSSNQEAEVSQEAPLPRGNGELIMVVDDEPSVRQLTRQALEAFGYRVLIAADGSEAIALYATQQDSIAVVIMDMLMPDLDGIATMRVLRKMQSSVRIVATSGLNEPDAVFKASAVGAKHFLGKPYTTETLLGTVSKAITES